MIGTVLLVAVLVCAFLPETVSLAWHLVHGNTVEYESFTIPVPGGWWARSDEDSVTILKLRRLLNRGGSTSSIIVAPFAYPQDRAFDHDEWKRLITESRDKRGFRFVGEKPVQAAGERSYCLTFAASDNPQRLWIGCDFPHHQLSVGLIGNANDAPTLDLVLQEITVRN